VDDVDRYAGGLGQADHPVRRLALEDRLSGETVADRIGRAGGHGLLRDHVDGHAVLGVHHDQPAVLRGLLHGPKDRPVVAVEHARIGREQLEVRHTLRDELVHLGERRVVDVAHDHVEAVVGDGVAFGLGVPGIESFAERRPARLHGEVHDHGRAAEGGCPCARLECVLREGAAERQLHVRVDIDGARDDVAARRVDGVVGRQAGTGEIRADGRDRLPIHEDVRGLRAIRRDDGAVGDERSHRSPPGPNVRSVRKGDGRRWRCAGMGAARSAQAEPRDDRHERLRPGRGGQPAGDDRDGDRETRDELVAKADAPGIRAFEVPPGIVAATPHREHAI
jgi:hypothetical protein